MFLIPLEIKGAIEQYNMSLMNFFTENEKD